VVATVVYVGFRVVVVGLTSAVDTDAAENWMPSGLAVLLLAAFSLVVNLLCPSLRPHLGRVSGSRLRR